MTSQLTQAELGVLADAVRLGRLGAATQEERDRADLARNTLIEAYMPLAQHLASKYVAKLGRSEALSAAYFGLTMALRSWDPDKGALPSWIRLYCKNALLRDCDRQSLIRLPQEKAPKKAMIAHYAGQGYDLVEISDKVGMSVQQVTDLKAAPDVKVWLDENDQDVPTDCHTSVSETVVMVNNLLSGLPELQRKVVAARFGIDHGGLVHTYEEIAEMYEIDLDEVRSLEAKGLQQLMTMRGQVPLL
jgi:RNA polymerase sigma factor (sigma-70 family)